VKTSISALIFAIALTQQRAASAADTFRALLLAPNEPPDSQPCDGSRVAFVVLDGTWLTFAVRLDSGERKTAVHLHKGAAVSGDIVIHYENGPLISQTIDAGLAGDLVANPQSYWVDVHTPGFPNGAYMGQLRPGPGLSPADRVALVPGSGDIRRSLGLPLQAGPPRAPFPAARAVAAGSMRAIGQGTVWPPLAPGDKIPDPEVEPPSLGPREEQTIRFRELPLRYYRDSDFRLYATSSSGLEVQFTASGDCRLYGSYVHLLSAGKCSVTAHQPGNRRFDAADDVEQRFAIAKAGQTISASPLGPRTYLDPDFPLYASASSGLSVVFRASGDCTVSGAVVHLAAAGTCWITTHQPGDSNFTAAPIVDQQFAIAKAEQTIDFPPLPPPDRWGFAFPLQAVASSGLPVGFTASGSCLVTLGGILQYIGYGSCTVTALQPGDWNVNPAPSVTQTFVNSPPG
jgi:hypothetical protein